MLWCRTCPARASTRRSATPAGVEESILESYFSGKHDYRLEDLIVHQGDYATKAYGLREKK